jgi:hypothetical protein
MKNKHLAENGYLYFHIRNDTNEVFYIGVGTDTTNFYRSRTKSNRSKWWKNIVNKVGYTIEIVFRNMPLKWILAKEIELIALYGRADLKRGNLVNLTAGGEGSLGRVVSEESKRKMSKAHKGVRKTPEACRAASLGKKGLPMSPAHKAALDKARQCRRTHAERLQENPNYQERRLKIVCRPVNQLDLDSNFIKRWPSLISTRLGGFSSDCVGLCCKNKQNAHRGFKWEFAEKEEI